MVLVVPVVVLLISLPLPLLQPQDCADDDTAHSSRLGSRPRT